MIIRVPDPTTNISCVEIRLVSMCSLEKSYICIYVYMYIYVEFFQSGLGPIMITSNPPTNLSPILSLYIPT